MKEQDINGVTRAYLSADFGYDFFNYENKNEEFKYFETFTFPKDQGLQILDPDLGEKFDVELSTNESKMVILRLTNNVYQKSLPLGFNLVLGDDSLIQNCL